MTQFQAIIFDFDGLIIETESPDFQAWQEVFASYSCHLDRDEWTEAIGSMDHSFNPYDELERQLGRPLDREAVRQQRRPRYLALVKNQPIMAGVEEKIAKAEQIGLKLGVASSSDCSWVKGHLEERGLRPHFSVVTCRDDVPWTKPDPAVYQLALDRLGVQAAAAFAFEDSQNGILAAKAARMKAVAVPNAMTSHLDFQVADLILSSLADLSLDEIMAKLGQV